MSNVNFKPEGFHTVTPYLIVESVDSLSTFLQNAFGAEELLRMPGENGRIMHAEIKLGDSVIMMGEPVGEYQSNSAMQYVYLENVDNAYQKALDAGAVSEQPPEDQFYGDRTAAVKGPQGNFWWLATHVKDVSEEDLMSEAKSS